MTPAQRAAGYRQRAELWRRQAARIRQTAQPHGQGMADIVAGKWEERAAQFDADADDFDAQSRMEIADDRQPEA